jgi:hypothetical protein
MIWAKKKSQNVSDGTNTFRMDGWYLISSGTDNWELDDTFQKTFATDDLFI